MDIETPPFRALPDEAPLDMPVQVLDVAPAPLAVQATRPTGLAGCGPC